MASAISSLSLPNVSLSARTVLLEGNHEKLRIVLPPFDRWPFLTPSAMLIYSVLVIATTRDNLWIMIPSLAWGILVLVQYYFFQQASWRRRVFQLDLTLFRMGFLNHEGVEFWKKSVRRDRLAEIRLDMDLNLVIRSIDGDL